MKHYLFPKYFPQGKPGPYSNYWPAFIYDRWRLAYGEPGRYSRARTMRKRIGCLRNGGFRLIYQHRATGKIETISHPELYQYLFECL